MLEGLGANRDALQCEHAVLRYANTSLHPVVHEGDSLVLVIDNTFQPSSQISIELYYAVGY